MIINRKLSSVSAIGIKWAGRFLKLNDRSTSPKQLQIAPLHALENGAIMPFARLRQTVRVAAPGQHLTFVSKTQPRIRTVEDCDLVNQLP